MVAALAAISCRLASPSGPRSLNQDRSTRWEAIFWLLVIMFVVLKRCASGLKYPRETEKL